MLNIHRSKKSTTNSPMVGLQGLIAQRRNEMLNPSHSVLSTESMSDDSYGQIEKSHSSISTMIQSGLDGISNLQADAMATTVMMCSDAGGLSGAMTSHLGEEISTESFAEDSIIENLHLTVGIAGELVLAESAASFIFPPVLLDSATTNYELRSVRNVIEPKFYHGRDKSVTDWNKSHLLDAAIVDDMLQGDLNIFIPELTVPVKDNFISADFIQPWSVTRTDGQEVQTSYLGLCESNINLITLSTAKGMLRNSEASILDRIDEGGTIEGIIISIGDAADGNAAYLSTAAANRRTFTRSQTASDDNSRMVTFDDTMMTINLEEYITPEKGGFKDIADIPALKALKDAGYKKIGFKISNTYTLDLSTGTYRTTASKPTLEYVESEAGKNALVEARAANGALLDAISAAYLGSDIRVSLSNRTLSLTGDNLGTEALTKLYPLNVHTPFEVRKDILSKNTDSENIRMMAQGINLRRESETVTDLKEWFEWGKATLGHEGIAPHNRKDLNIINLHLLTKPYVRDIDIDLLKLLKEEDTTGKFEVLEVGMVSKMQHEILTMFQQTNYRSVARNYGGKPSYLPKIGLLGDALVNSYIMRTGEGRTFGDGEAMDEKPAFFSSDRESLRNTIYAFPVVEDVNDKDMRTFGFGHSIELANIVVKRSRDNGVVHDQVQLWPIYSNIVTTPLLIRFNILNLNEYLSEASKDTVVAP